MLQILFDQEMSLIIFSLVMRIRSKTWFFFTHLNYKQMIPERVCLHICGLTKLPLNLWHGWIITPHTKPGFWLLIHALIPVNFIQRCSYPFCRINIIMIVSMAFLCRMFSIECMVCFNLFVDMVCVIVVWSGLHGFIWSICPMFFRGVVLARGWCIRVFLGQWNIPKVQYIPRNMHTVLLCFALLWLCNRS